MPDTEAEETPNALQAALAKSDDALTEEDLRVIGKHQMLHHRTRSPGADYSAPKVFDNAAIYTTALSGGYVKSIEEFSQQEEQALISGNPNDTPFSGFDFGADDLKFIKPESKLCFYPWVLFSAGQGAKTDAAADEVNWITERVGRDPRVVVLGDSGGFQIQGQSIAFDPQTTPIRMLKWLERIADQSMVLDFPTGGIATGAMEPHVQRLEAEGIAVSDEAKQHGFSRGYMACLLETERNNDIFLKHRTPGATAFLNVIQGRNELESLFWYQRVKRFSQAQKNSFEGWAFAGKHSVQLTMTLRRLIEMRDDGLLQPDQFIHFLGVSTLKVGAALTFIQRSLRKHTDATNAQITFDSKSPVDMMANGYRAITGFDLSPNKWSLHSQPTNSPENATSNLLLRDMARSWAAQGEYRQIARTGLGDILKLKDLVAQPDPNGGKAVPGKLQQALLVHHNTQAMIEAFRCAYKLLDDKQFNERPSSVRWMGEMIDMVFNTQAPMTLINELEQRAREISAESLKLHHDPEGKPGEIDELDAEARINRDIASDLRRIPAHPTKLIDRLEPQIDALAYEGVFGK